MFDIVENKLTILPEILTYVAMRKLWDSDKSKNKETALLKFAYLYHYYNRHSNFWNTRDDLKHKEIFKHCFPDKLDSEWDPNKDDLFQSCVEVYKKILNYSPKHYALDCAKEGLYTIGDTMKNDKSKISNIQSAMETLDKAFDNFDNLKLKADREEIKEGLEKIKGNLKLGKRQR